jgi:DHA1 family multidrug resistance protein-like MFS transporter
LNARRQAPEVREAPWGRNLAVVWLSQFLSITAFAFALPFTPFYLQELGVTDPGRLKIWVALCGSATPLSLAVFSPIWGTLADRFGRRLMLMRAHAGAAVVLSLMSMVHTPSALLALRLAQGAFAGTLTAAQTLAVSIAPGHRSGLALGMMSAAVYSGGMTGAFLGGITAHLFGFRVAYHVAGVLQACCLVLVWLGTSEAFSRPRIRGWYNPRRLRVHWVHLTSVFPILALFTMTGITRMFDMAFLPLLVQEIHGRLEGASLWTGGLNATGGIAGLCAGLALGYLADRTDRARMVRWAAGGAAGLMVAQGLARSFAVLLPVRFGLVFCAGALEPAIQAWLAERTAEKRRGLIFGWVASARALGWMLAPLISGAVAAAFGLRAIYPVGAVLYLLLVFAALLVLRTMGPSHTPKSA